MKGEFLLELGVEEMPASFCRQVKKYLGDRGRGQGAWSESIWRMFHWDDSNVRLQVWVTPRRIGLSATGVGGRQMDQRREGPPLAIAQDTTGRWTDAALGFAKKCGVAAGQLSRATVGGKDRVVATIPGAPTLQSLAPLVTELIKGMPVAKAMRWDASGVRFIRPVRWVLMVWNGRVVPWRWGLLRAGNRTFSSDVTSSKSASVSSQTSYEAAVRRWHVVWDPDERRGLIERGLNAHAGRMHAKPMSHAALLDETVYLTERPFLVAGDFDKRFLSLPSEVIHASLSKHQRLFALAGSDGRPIAQFVAVLNGARPAASVQIIRRNISRILEAKLQDSQFFWQEDSKIPLQTMASKLSGMTYHQKLGSLADKVERVRQLAVKIAGTMDCGHLSPSVDRAARLCKADLASQMVYEFPDLQGEMGYYYALSAGESKEVAEAIREHYHPRFAEDNLPQTGAGKILSVADKLDSLIGFFSIGLFPTGSEDPYALRRQAVGVLRIVQESGDISLSDYMRCVSEKPFPNHEKLMAFMKERLRWLWVNRGKMDADLVDAVMQAGGDRDPLWHRVAYCTRLIGALQAKRRTPEFEKAREVVERVVNILADDHSSGGAVDPSLLRLPEEKTLWDLWQSRGAQLEDLVGKKQGWEATEFLARHFAVPLHQFFDKVMVNDPDERLRSNRKRLLKTLIWRYTNEIADLSKIQKEK